MHDVQRRLPVWRGRARPDPRGEAHPRLIWPRGPMAVHCKWGALQMKISHLVVASIALASTAVSLTEGCSGSDDARHPCYQRAQCLNQPYPTNSEGQACGFLYNDPACG